MAAGVSFEKAMDVTDESPPSDLQCDIAMVRLGVLPRKHLDISLYRDKIYMVTVPSLNIEGGTHCIIVTTFKGKEVVFDPQKGRKNKKFYSNDWEGITLKSWCGITECIRVNNEKI